MVTRAAPALRGPAARRYGGHPASQRAPQLADDRVEELVRATLQELPKGATHWSTRKLAKLVGVSQSSVSRVWRAFHLKPHRRRTFTLSNDEFFVEKVRDIVGLYLNPPDHAVVLCLDEKSQIQALERRQPVLPLIFGQPERVTATYNRHGTTNLFAALDVAPGKVIGECYPLKRAAEFRRFLSVIDKQVPPELAVHVVVDNSSTHASPPIRRWLRRHPRFHVHFTPTYSSWLNLVERWFAARVADRECACSARVRCKGGTVETHHPRGVRPGVVLRVDALTLGLRNVD